MKILHCVPSLSPAMGGPTEVVIHLVQALRRIGVESEIVTTDDDVDGTLPVPLGVRTEYRGVPCWFFRRSALRKRQYIFSAQLTAWLWNNVSYYDMVDIHYLFTYSSTCASWVCRARGVPYSLRTIGQLSPWSLRQSALRKAIYGALIEKTNLRRAGAIHCTTAGEAEDVERYGVTSPRVVIPLGVIVPSAPPESRLRLRQQYGIPAVRPVILFLSRLHPKKRLELLFEAFQRLRADGTDADLFVAGAGNAEYEQSLKQLASDLGISDRTHWLGFVEGADKDSILAAADIYVLPSFSENFGIAVAEALAASLPVVITPEVQIAPEVSAHDAGLVVPGTVEAVTGALSELITKPERRRQLGQNGLRLVQALYSWERTAESCLGVYRKLVSEAGSKRRRSDGKPHVSQ